MRAGKVLTCDEIDHFIDRGWVLVHEAYARADALAAQDDLWREVEKRGVMKSDRATWNVPLLRINETFDSPAFRRCNTDRLADAIEDLVGVDRWSGRGKPVQWGWWPVNFSHGAEKVWDVPTQGWHWDGIHFRHHVDSPDQGLLCLCLFSDVGPEAGGTVVAEGSHKVVARYLQGRSDGVDIGDGIQGVLDGHEWFRMLSARQALPAHSQDRKTFFMQPRTDPNGVTLRVVETLASAGDVILCHPFLFHATAQNLSGNPRFMCNRTTPLKDRLKLDTVTGYDTSPLEVSIQRAIGQ